jgi:hypothetical protein
MDVLWIGIALAMRGLCSFPLFRNHTEPDALLGALCGLRVLRGDFPIFFPSGRFGSAECFAAAPVIAALGTTRLAAAVVAWLLGAAQVLLHFSLLRELLGSARTRRVLPLLALYPPAVFYWAGVLNNNATTLLLSTAVLWWAARCSRRGGVAAHLVLGTLTGLAFWQSIQTLIVIVPALVFACWPRRRSLTLGVVAAIVVGFALGASPWISFNVAHDWGSLRGNYAAQPATAVSMLVGNARNLLTYRIPDLLAAERYQGQTRGAAVWFVHLLRPVVLLIYSVLTLAAAAAAATG